MTANNAEPISVDIPEACRLSGLGRSKMYELLNSGEVASIKVGKRRLVVFASLRDRLTKAATDHAV